MLEINENDNNSVIIIKLIIVILTIITIALGAFQQGIEILKFRFRKKPRMGFTTERNS